MMYHENAWQQALRPYTKLYLWMCFLSSNGMNVATKSTEGCSTSFLKLRRVGTGRMYFEYVLPPVRSQWTIDVADCSMEKLSDPSSDLKCKTLCTTRCLIIPHMPNAASLWQWTFIDTRSVRSKNFSREGCKQVTEVAICFLGNNKGVTAALKEANFWWKKGHTEGG